MKGGTLLETLVALVILAFCFSLSAMIFVSVLNSSGNSKLLHATAQLNEISMQTQKSGNYLDEEIQTDEFKFLKKIHKRENTKNLIELKITAYDNTGHLVAERKELMIVSE
jgi:hypothetical protein